LDVDHTIDPLGTTCWVTLSVPLAGRVCALACVLPSTTATVQTEDEMTASLCFRMTAPPYGFLG
jgi:hypothetical protein